MALDSIIRKSAFIAALGAAAIIAKPEQASAQTTCNPKVEVCTTTDRPSQGFFDTWRARISRSQEVVPYIRQTSCTTATGNAQPGAQPTCQAPAINVVLKGTDGSTYNFTQKSPGVFKTHINFNPDSNVCYSFHKTTPDTDIIVPDGNPRTTRWLAGDNCFSGKELGRREYDGMEGPVVAAVRDGWGKTYVVEATPVGGARQRTAPRTTTPTPRRTTEEIIRETGERIAERAPEYGIDLKNVPENLTVPTEALAKVEGLPIYVRFTTNGGGKRSEIIDDQAPYTLRLDPERLPRGGLQVCAEAVYRNDIRSDCETTNVVNSKSQRITSNAPVMEGNGYFSIGAGGVMEEADIANGVPRNRHFRQGLEGFFAEGEGVYSAGPLHVEGGALYNRMQGEQTSRDTNNRSEIDVANIEVDAYALLTTRMGLGLAAEGRYHLVSSEEKLKRNEAEPLMTIKDEHSTTSYAAGVGYSKDYFTAAVMAGKQNQPDGYAWDESRNGIIGRLSYDGLSAGKKYSLDGRFERFTGEKAPTGIDDYDSMVEFGTQWNASRNFSVGANYRMTFGDGAEEISGNQLRLGVKYNLPVGK